MILHRKLKRLKLVLRKFNEDHFAGISERIKAKRRELDGVQLRTLSNSATVEEITQEQEMRKELQNLVIAEESFYR